MNRPSTLYTYLPDKHYDSNSKILKEVSKVFLEYLEREKTITTPIGNIGLVRTKFVPRFRMLADKYENENYRLTNAHTDGYVISTVGSFKVNGTSKFRGSRNFKLYVYKKVKRLQKKLAHSDNWMDIPIKYDK